ncbi:hypothetical protein D9619_005613 [Psilocybe cf. subviscida]|uniref:precorrin-2 dehydrogenase n=1 Tax=Psilocybe cf. subviscida TaxID=2480587 RepID=A0A8H5FBU9_9AGAR|nr:hypothetical protein D9619_005613 [Psilocybe cf. subviscida]
MDSDTDARIQSIGGGSLLIAWQLKDKNVLIVGGGEVASQRIESILTADAHITVVSPEHGLNARTRRFIELRKDRVVHHDREFSGPEELDGMDMVLTALDDNDLSRQIVETSRSRRIPVNAADIPDLCDFYFGAQVRDGPLQIMISTNGNGPRIASLIKTKIQHALSGQEGEAIIKVGKLRSKLKERARGVGGPLGRARMKWMSGLCNTWELEDFAVMDESAMDKILDEGWEKNARVPTVEEIGISRPRRKEIIPTATILPTSIGFLAGALVAAFVIHCTRKL